MDITTGQVKAGRPKIGGEVLIRLGPLVAQADSYAARHGINRAAAVRRLVAAGLRAPLDYGIYSTSGEPHEGIPGNGAISRRYSPAEAAAIAAQYPWAAVDDDGDVIVGMYKTRAAWGGGTPVPGAELAARL